MSPTAHVHQFEHSANIVGRVDWFGQQTSRLRRLTSAHVQTHADYSLHRGSALRHSHPQSYRRVNTGSIACWEVDFVPVPNARQTIASPHVRTYTIYVHIIMDTFNNAPLAPNTPTKHAGSQIFSCRNCVCILRIVPVRFIILNKCWVITQPLKNTALGPNANG